MAWKKRCPRTTLATQLSTMTTCSDSNKKSKKLRKSKRRSRRNRRSRSRRPILTLTLRTARASFPLARLKRRKSQVLFRAVRNRPCIRRRMDLIFLITALSLSHNSTRYTILMTISLFMVLMTVVAILETMLWTLAPSLRWRWKSMTLSKWHNLWLKLARRVSQNRKKFLYMAKSILTKLKASISTHTLIHLKNLNRRLLPNPKPNWSQKNQRISSMWLTCLWRNLLQTWRNLRRKRKRLRKRSLKLLKLRHLLRRLSSQNHII